MGNKKNKPSKDQESVLVTSLDTNGLISDLQQMIDDARATVSVSVNAGLTFLYWRIGQRLNREILKGKRAGYGKGILATVSQVLSWSHLRQRGSC